MEQINVITTRNSLASITTLHDDLLVVPLINSNNKNLENLGLFYVFLANFIFSFNSFLTKVIQIFYPSQFSTNSFLFIRTIIVFSLTIFSEKVLKEHILSYHEIAHKLAFITRSFLSYFSVFFFTISVLYLRLSTSQIISLLNPIILILLSTIILKEKFHMRYLYGLFFCLGGAFIIVLNEKKANSHQSNTKEFMSIETLIGIGFGMLANVAGALNWVANKVLTESKVPINTQMYYVSLSTFGCSFVGIIYDGQFGVSIGYVCLCMIQGLFYYLGQNLINKGISMIELSKTAVMTYFKIIWVFILGGIFLGEKIFLTDLLGSAVIIGYQIYNIYSSMKEEGDNDNDNEDKK